MATYASELAQPDPLTAEHAAQIRTLAAHAWRGMENHGVLPTPRAFDLWFTHASGANPELSRRMTAMLDQGAAFTATALDMLYSDCAHPELDVDAIADGAKAIQQAAQAVVDQVTGNGEELRRYGDTLVHWTAKLAHNRTVDGLMQAVATLTTETARAGERNRTLQQQLTASAARITRLKDSLEEVKREATIDVLTGLSNRKAFDARLRRALLGARTDGSRLSVLLLDVDHFKRVNDNHGHHTGDLVLRLIGRLLSDSVKGRDTAARYGGEEFAVILAGADLHAGATVADQIRAALEGKHLINKRSGQACGEVTMSVGVAQFWPGDTASALIDRADAALYRAKHLGRNRVCVEEAQAASAA